MPNTIITAEKMVPVVDELYRKASLTSPLDATTQVDFSGTKTVKVMKVETSGLGDYSRENGYPRSNTSVTWEELTLNEERAAAIGVDRMDDDETLGKAFGTAIGKFVREHVAPELDAYRFAKYASGEGINSITATYADGAALLHDIDIATAKLDDEEVPENRILYIASELRPQIMDAFTRNFGGDASVSRTVKSYNDMNIVYVPRKRFYTGITLNDGSSNWGYVNTGDKINFMIICPESVTQTTKLAMPKIFDPDTNILKDEWLFQYRHYHDAFIYEQKVNGIYLSKAGA